MSLPTYVEANTRPDPWYLIAASVPALYLPTCALVSRHWYRIFAPLFWTEPTQVLLARKDGYGEYHSVPLTQDLG
jgi:hypothetical protein